MKRASPLSLGGLLGILLACALAFYLLVPGRKRLLQRLVEDGKAQRALSVLASMPPDELARDPEFYELMRLRLSRQLLAPGDQAGLRAQVEAALLAFERSRFRGEFLTETVESISLLNDPVLAWKLASPHLPTFPREARELLVGILVQAALASDQPAVAAAIHEIVLQPFPPAETNLVEAVRLWRAAARPGRALEVLAGFERQAPEPSSALGPALAELKFHLLRELSRNREAFDLAASLAVSSEAGTVRQTWVQRMEVTAETAAHRRKLLAEYRHVVRLNPADADTWSLIAALAIAAEEPGLAIEALQKRIDLTPGDRASRQQLAQLYEWNDDPGRAFDQYLPLAEQNDSGALERLIALNPGLYRDREVLRVLRRLNGEALPDPCRLVLARLLIRHGEYAEAYGRYEEHLQKHTQDVAVLEEYARSLQRQQSYASALVAWKRLLDLKPDDESVQASIAETYYLLGEFDLSFRAYQPLVGQTTNLATLRNFCTLAESLGEFRALSDGLGREIELKPRIDPADFIRRAYVLSSLGADAEQQAVLELGLARWPDNDGLRLKLAVLLVARKETARAVTVLARSGSLKTDLTALRLYLDLLVARGEFAVAEKFLGSGLDERVLAARVITSLQVLIYEGTRNDDAAEKVLHQLYRQHPGEVSVALDYFRILARRGKARTAWAILLPLLKDATPEILREAARVSAQLGDYQQAERLQARVLEFPGKPRFQDWSYLGDIRYAAGHRSAARRAYRQALASAEINLDRLPP